MSRSSRRLLEDHLHRLYGYAVSLSGNSDEAKDLVQECCLRALGAAKVPADGSAYRAWLFKILRNVFIDGRRRRRKTTGLEDLETWESGFSEYWDADDRLINVITVKAELSRLDARHREIIGLIDICGFSYAETAEALDIPVGTVMSRISRARAALLAAINQGNIRPLGMGRRS